MARWRGRQLIAGGWGIALASALAMSGAVAPARAQPVVQPLPGGASQALNSALTRLGRDPRDLGALIDAGNAALMMGDVDAAIGFFARADQLSPNNARVKAGLAGAMVRSENPYDAIPLFTEAEQAGGMDPLLVSDRGLAYDLVGDTVTAQRYYRQAIAAGGNDETLRRLALSQAISGDRMGMETTLSPLLLRQDKGAWRTRVFGLAILGRAEDAVGIANQTMPANLASGIAPYLRYMMKLTPAQQAAAANFGRFPRAADIGHDDPRVALYAPPRHVAGVDAGLVPAGEPLGRGKSHKDSRDKRRQAAVPPPVIASVASAVPAASRTAPPEPMPTRQTSVAPSLAIAPPPAKSVAAAIPAPVAAQPMRVAIAPPAAASASASASASVTSAAQAMPTRAPAPVAQPGFTLAQRATPNSTATFDLSRVPSTASATPVPGAAPVGATAAVPAPVAPRAVTPVQAVVAPLTTAPVQSVATVQAVPTTAPIPVLAPPPAPAPKPRRVADAFADFTVPQGPAAPAPGAVDIRKIAPTRPKPAEPPKPVHPSRIWVQVGTGRSTSALGFTWRGLVKDDPDLFRSKDASVSDWGRTNRLLTGPFATEAAASSFLAKLKKAGVDAFVWTSPTGQVVDDLPSR